MSRDLEGEQAAALLGAVTNRLDGYDAPVCRSFVAPGASAPWDVCCECAAGEGQAWVAIERVYPADPFPSQDSGAQRCHPAEYGVELVAGVLRCAHTVDDRGHPPDAGVVTGDADKVGFDRAVVREAILCDFAGDADPGTFRLGAWTPLGPSGGCVGGAWRLTAAAGSCGCPETFPPSS